MISACTWKILTSVLNYLNPKASMENQKRDSEPDFIKFCCSQDVLHARYDGLITWVSLITFSKINS